MKSLILIHVACCPFFLFVFFNQGRTRCDVALEAHLNSKRIPSAPWHACEAMHAQACLWLARIRSGNNPVIMVITCNSNNWRWRISNKSELPSCFNRAFLVHLPLLSINTWVSLNNNHVCLKWKIIHWVKMGILYEPSREITQIKQVSHSIVSQQKMPLVQVSIRI